jgi:hypothetical protein
MLYAFMSLIGVQNLNGLSLSENTIPSVSLLYENIKYIIYFFLSFVWVLNLICRIRERK